MLCIHCGADNPENAKFCSACGKTVEDGASEEAATITSETVENPQAAPQVSSQAGVAAGAVEETTEPGEELPSAPLAVPESSARPQFAPPSLEQAVALLESEKRYPWVAIPVGLLSFLIFVVILVSLPNASTYFVPLSILGATAIYLATQFYLLPFFRPAFIRCRHCSGSVPQAKEALPKAVWPWSCPHCRQELVPPHARKSS